MAEATLWKTLARDACLERSIAGTARLVAGEVLVLGLVVCRTEVEKRQVVLVASDWAGEPSPASPWQLWSDAQLDDLLMWHRAGAPRRGTPQHDRLLGLLWPSSDACDVVAWPLPDERHDPGVLLIVCERGALVGTDERDLGWIAEAFAAAFTNDRRFHEITRLQESLEADRRALLSRLDRDNVVDAVVGADAGLADLMEKVKQVAPTDVPVLIFGETGSGKEVVARVIHAQSRRRDNPVVRVNCGAIPAGLVDSSLFGHERGSFTGAVATHQGWFERADGGTLFLDEVGELPLEAQVRLLRVLQEGTIERVGGTRTIHVDVRIVAATNRDIKEMVGRGAFREDLWYRLSVFPIELPPLRERHLDLPELAAHFAARAGRRLGGAPLVPTASDVELLLGYDWPGNVRELAAVIERAAILGNGKFLDVRAALGTSPAADPFTRGKRPGPSGGDSFPTLDQAMRTHIEEALKRTRGAVEGERGAARLLGINPHTLRSRMRKLGIRWARFRPGTGQEGPE